MRALLFGVSDSLAIADFALLGQRLMNDVEWLAWVYFGLLAGALATRAVAELCAEGEINS